MVNTLELYVTVVPAELLVAPGIIIFLRGPFETTLVRSSSESHDLKHRSQVCSRPKES